MSKYTDDEIKSIISEYTRMRRQYQVDIAKKIDLEKKNKLKARQINRLERTIKSMEKDMAEYSKLFDSQTEIALHYMKLVNNFIKLVKDYHEQGKIEKDVCIEIVKYIQDNLPMEPNEQ